MKQRPAQPQRPHLSNTALRRGSIQRPAVAAHDNVEGREAEDVAREREEAWLLDRGNEGKRIAGEVQRRNGKRDNKGLA